MAKATIGDSFADGTKNVAEDCLTNYSLDTVEDKIMDYMGVLEVLYEFLSNFYG